MIIINSRTMHWSETVGNLTERLQNITFIQKSIPVSHLVFKIKSTEKHATIFDKVKGVPDRVQQFRILPTLFYKKVMWPQEKSFLSVLTITDKHKTSVLVKMCSKKYFQTGF